MHTPPVGSLAGQRGHLSGDGSSFIWSPLLLKTNVYVDGFNLYYGSVRGTPYHWLDVAKLCQAELPSNKINRIRYFTALVSARPADPQQPARQQTYLRALQTLPDLTIHYGEFLRNPVRMALVN